MKEKTLKVLEFDKIKELLAKEATNDFSRKMAMDLLPSCDISHAAALYKELSETLDLYVKHGMPQIFGMKDISAALRRSEVGGALNAAELLDVALVLKITGNLLSYYNENNEDSLSIDKYFGMLSPNRKLENSIFEAIISEDEIADDASPNLRGIRRQILNTHEKIRGHLNNIIHSSHYQKYLQEPIITIRGGRYVVPVKAEYRAEFGGIVHDMSATGSTVFIEPGAVVAANNTLRELAAREKAEIERILAELSAKVAEMADALFVNQRVIAELDFLFAKAKLATKLKAVIPVINDKGIVNIIKGRHPLLDEKKVVPITVYLGESFKTLVITGPNTGGKTVSLKTVGLFSLMAASGLAVPAADGTQLCIFDRVFADIGDEQSIEQSLSTFSSHMTNIVSILSNITEKSLVLFDELGAGTDPTEGAALAIAILKYVKDFGACTVATTHYSELKLYALSTEGVENAACEFDVNSLKPTYRLLIGVPGKSNAFAISKRLGLPEFIIDSANKHLTEESIRFEDVVANLEKNRQEAEKEREQAQRLRLEVESLKKELEAEKAKLLRAKEKLADNAKREAKAVLENAKREAEEVINSIKEAQKLKDKKELDRALAQSKQRLIEGIKKMDKPRPQKRANVGAPPKNLLAGSSVYLLDIGQNGIVVSPPKDDGSVTVQVGIMKINSHISNLRLVQEQEVKKPTPATKGKSGSLRSDSIKSEIDLRGTTVDEALILTEKYLDDAYLASLNTVTIIHGKGTGALRQGIHNMLRRNPHVKSFRLGTFGEGESGVTIVTLKP